MNNSLRAYLRQLSNYVSILIPLFFEQKFRFSKVETLKQLIINEYNLELQNITKLSPKSSQLDKFVQKNLDYFGMSSDGLCKYCNSFNLNMSNKTNRQINSIDGFLTRTIETHNEYSKIITSIILTEDEQPNEGIQFKHSVALSKNILRNLPNLANISIKSIRISEIDEYIKECQLLKNIELVQNDLTSLSPNLFSISSMLNQVIIENNPITEIPVSLFGMQSLRVLKLSRLNLTSLPDKFLENLDSGNETCIGIRSLFISETRLNALPKDLIIGNISLEQLTFQGVKLILPENESQWSFLMVDYNKIKESYCPNLLSLKEAKAVFKRFDVDNNNILDFVELQKFNAFIFKHFPRLGEIIGRTNKV